MSVRRQMDRRALFASGAAAALLAATGVGAGTAPGRGGHLRMALSGATRADRFDWRRLGPNADRQELGLFMQVAMVGAVFDTLTEVAADGTLRGELATGWRSDADGSHWVFDLREGVFFHDGTLFTAEDVRVSFEPLLGASLSDVAAIDTDGPNRVIFRMHVGDPHLPFRLSNAQMLILPLGFDPARDASANDPMKTGTGLYRLDRFEPGRQFIGTRVDRHYKDGRAGWFDSVEIVSLPSDEVRAEALREHYVHAVDLTHSADLGDLGNITLLPEEHFMTAAVDKGVALPARIGSRWPMDNLRAAERWWMA